MSKLLQALTALALVFVGAGCSHTGTGSSGTLATLTPPGANGGMFRKRNEGYSLLYDLMKEDGDVGKIFILKHASDKVGNLIRAVGQTCQSAKKKMDEFPKSDKRIEFDVPDLPAVEQRGRTLESKYEEHQLLHKSGKEFEFEIIYSQAKSTRYAVDLCDALKEIEDHPDRKQFLTDLSDRFNDLNQKLMDMMQVK